MACVLVADDDALPLQLVAEYLKAKGHQVICASDGGQARSALGPAVDILITDLHMPVLTGFDLIAHARSLPRKIPIIMVSGTWTAEERAKATRLGIARLYDKPADLEQVSRDVAELAKQP